MSGGRAGERESATSLAKILAQLLRDPSRLARMGNVPAEWSREFFSPAIYAPRVVANLV
jgi:hypothetical protein